MREALALLLTIFFVSLVNADSPSDIQNARFLASKKAQKYKALEIAISKITSVLLSMYSDLVVHDHSYDALIEIHEGGCSGANCGRFYYSSGGEIHGSMNHYHGRNGHE